MRNWLLILSLLLSVSIYAQINPVITGDTMLCPNETGKLTTTQPYDTYQWYFHGYNDTTWTAFGNNGNQRTISITEKHVLNYFKVEVTNNGDTGVSKEVLVDQWVFLLPTVATEGDFSIGDNGETEFCAGDTVHYILQSPYDTNITWFHDGTILPGQNDDTLLVELGGSYTVQGAPFVCPNYIVQLGVTLEAIRFVPTEPQLVQSNDTLLVKDPGSFTSLVWYKDGQLISGANGAYYQPSSAGDFYVITEDLNGCQDTSDTITFTPSGIDNPAKNSITVHPNPASDFLDFNIHHLDDVDVEVFNSSGTKVLTRKNIRKNRIDISKLNPGIYLLSIKTEDRQLRAKFVKE